MMGISRQLYQLQEIDLEIDAKERALINKTGQLGESQALIDSRVKLAAERQKLDGLKRQQRSAETEIEDLSAKIAAIDEKLYSGRIRNPKELSDLQQEGNILKTKRDHLESRALETMEQVEASEAAVAGLSGQFKRVESEWQAQQQKLSAEIEQVKGELAEARDRHQPASDAIEPETLRLYEKLRKQKGQALSRIEQGICQGCRISLSSNEIQQARCGNVVLCSSCGRILHLP